MQHETRSIYVLRRFWEKLETSFTFEVKDYMTFIRKTRPKDEWQGIFSIQNLEGFFSAVNEEFIFL